MEEGLIVRWLKHEGDTVSEGEAICEVETEKTTDEIQAPASGVLLKIVHTEGEAVPVNAVIAVIGSAGEDVASVPEYSELSAPVVGPPSTQRSELTISPSREPAPSLERIRMSPSARRLARERGIDVTKIKGTGPDGRIVAEDVLRGVEKPEARHPTEAYRSTPLTGHREVIADRLALSARTAVHVPISMEVDMTSGTKLKSDQEKAGTQISYNDLIIKAAATSLEEFPHMNSMLLGKELRTMQEINVGVAVGLEDDLLVPVIRNANRMSLVEISNNANNLIERARNRVLTTKEMSEGTFTVSNLGMYEVDLFAPIINPPETAILGVGRIVPKPVAVGGSIMVRPMMTLTLVFDHRVADGVLAAKFLQRIKQLLEAPEEMVVRTTESYD
jgi:pyruvate dehydrogenase E2 component (dihydrolipoamide acetyltransferase)